MSELSITDTAFTGFRVVREHPKALISWVLLNLFIGAPLTYALTPMLLQMEKLAAANGAETPEQLLAALQPALPMMLAATAVYLMVQAVVWAAMNRAVLNPQDDRFGYMRLGMDELRQLGLILAVTGLSYLLVGVVAAVLSLALGAVASAQAVAILVLFITLVAVGPRLAMASALTFERRKIDLFGAWALSKGRYRPLLATLALAFVMSLCVLILSAQVVKAITAVACGGVACVAVAAKPELTAWSELLQPARAAFFVLQAITQALVWPVWMTPPAAAYLALTRQSRYA